MIRSACIALLLSAVAAFPALGQADGGADELRSFLDGAGTLRAAFRQSMFSEESTEPQVSEGILMIKRPGRFRWEYAVPSEQLVVCDGESVWMYDKDLEQVTVRPIDDTLRGTPAMLLSGQATLDETFRVVESYQEDEVSWVALEPLTGSPEFASLRIGLEDGVLTRMELKDSLGQMTRIELFNVEADRALDDSLFIFEPPEGADVIGQGSDL